MSPETVELWCKLIDRYGVSVVMLLVFVVGTFWAVRWLAKNVAKPIAASHFQMAEALTETNEKNAKNLASLADSQASILKAVKDNGNQVSRAVSQQTTELKTALACRFKEA